MKDIKLINDGNSVYDHDILVENFDFVILNDGIDRVVQDLRIRLWFFLGEWFLNISAGVPFYQDIKIKNPDLNAIEAIFKEVIFNTDDVLEIISFDLDFNSAQRKMTVQFEVNTTFGRTGTITEVLI